MLPFMSLISEHIEDFPHNPVDKHRHPNGNQAKVTNISEYVSKHDSKYRSEEHTSELQSRE